MKLTKGKLAAALAAAAVLAAVFWYGGGAPGLRGWTAGGGAGGGPAVQESAPAASADGGGPEETPVPEGPASSAEPAPPAESAPPEGAAEQPEPSPGAPSTPPAEADSPGEGGSPPAAASPGAPGEKDGYLTDPVPEGRPLPVEPQDTEISEAVYTCTLSVRCDTILDNLDWLDPAKAELVPEDGVIFPAAPVAFYDGESVFNVLQREMKKAGVHMEFADTPMYNSVYIEGIGNLYEFDCGERSGWMYRVNGWFPNYGCSRYQLEPGDTVEWVYTCDLGADVGGAFAAGG